MRKALTLAAVVMMLSSACSKKPPPAAVVDARDAGDDAGGAAAEPLVDLLHWTDAHLAVSSKVDNARDLAEHIADGRLDTAWNGKTGDLVNGWIAFQVPRETRVKLIELTVGYDATSRKHKDLFLANHRISRVRVHRDGVVVVADHPFDPDKRGFQRIPLDWVGGDFKIQVLETKPGTKAEWKELVVSELRVFGVAGKAKRSSPGVPRVTVGAFDARPPLTKDLDAGPRPITSTLRNAATPAALCARWKAEASPLPEPKKKEGEGDGDDGPCSDLVYRYNCSTRELASENGAKLYAFDTLDVSETSGLALGYGGRVYEMPAVIDRHHVCDLGCGGQSTGGEFLKFRVEGGKAIATYMTWLSNGWTSMERYEDGGYGPANDTSTSYAKHEVTCTLGAKVECDDAEVDTKVVSPMATPPTAPAGWE